jgi:hypothetical protein
MEISFDTRDHRVAYLPQARKAEGREKEVCVCVGGFRLTSGSLRSLFLLVAYASFCDVESAAPACL